MRNLCRWWRRLRMTLLCLLLYHYHHYLHYYHLHFHQLQDPLVKEVAGELVVELVEPVEMQVVIMQVVVVMVKQ